MIKKSITLSMGLLMIFGVMSNLNAQDDDTSYAMWETIMLSPDHTKLKAFGENMRAHNQKYHKDAPYQGTVYTINTGPNTGKVVWMMGPLNYSHLDDRPGEGGHDEDWRDNIMPYVKKIHQGEYWRQDNDLSNTDMLNGDPSANPLLFVRYWELNVDQTHNLQRLLKQISSTVKAMEGENPWGVYYNEFRQGTKIGRHIATVGFFKKWAEFDEDPKFRKTFGELHKDPDAWDNFIRGMDNLLSDSWDEVWSYSKEMSGQ